LTSLRTTLLAGLAAIAVAVVGGFAGVVYARSHRVVRDAMNDHLRARAETLSGLMEFGPGGTEFEAGEGTLPGFERKGSGAYAMITGHDGRVVVRSPSLGDQRLPPPPPWEPGLVRFEELESGPDGIPCSTVTLAFLAKAEAADPEEGGWTPPDEERRRCRIQVALDSRERDRGLAGLAVFLAAAGAAAILATLGAGLLLARLVLRPVRRMTEEAAAISPGEPGRRLSPETVVAELDSLAATLNASLGRLDEALERQRRFTSDASHELRTPVSALLANTELLLRRPRTEAEYREGLERSLRMVRRMKEITENLLALARADAAAEGMERGPVPLDEVLSGVCDEFQGLAREKGVRVEREVAPGVRVLGDRRHLAQMSGNLLSNAVKFTPSGGSVSVRLAARGEEAEVLVADTGPGVPEEHRTRVFDRFYRVHGGRDREEGAGLGLAIVDRIVRAHGGSVAVAGREGGGAEFRVRLPLDRNGAPGATSPAGT